MSRFWSTLRPLSEPIRLRLRPGEVERRVAGMDLRAGDIAIDCGANVGNVTAAFARTGADVHAFEPNPDAFGVLADRFGNVPNVRLHRNAVLDRAGTARLYLHTDADRDPIGASIGSSVLAFKGNVDPERYVDVEAIDLSQFVLGLDRAVKIVKIDIEGAECSSFIVCSTPGRSRRSEPSSWSFTTTTFRSSGTRTICCESGSLAKVSQNGS